MLIQKKMSAKYYLGKCLEYGGLTEGNELLERRSTLLALGACTKIKENGEFHVIQRCIQSLSTYYGYDNTRKERRHLHKSRCKKELTQLLHQKM